MSDFQAAIPLSDLKEGEVIPARVSGVLLAFYLVDGQPYCTEDFCTHDENQLSDGGWVEGDEVECAYHGGRFNLKTGEPAGLPAVEAIRSYPVEVRDGQVYVSLT